MPYNTSTGVYTGPAGSTSAAPGDVIRSAVWNSINSDVASVLTQLAQQAYVCGPRTVASGSFTVAAADVLVFVTGSSPTITVPLAATKVGPVKIFGAASTVFGSATSKVVFSGGQTAAGLGTISLNTNWQFLWLYPTAGGYLIG